MANKEPKTQGKIEEQIKKEILFLSDHWTEDERMPFNFGGWLDEVVTDIYKIHLKEQQALLQRVIELIGESENEIIEDSYKGRGRPPKTRRQSVSMGARLRNNYRKELKTKISQMGEEYGK